MLQRAETAAAEERAARIAEQARSDDVVAVNTGASLSRSLSHTHTHTAGLDALHLDGANWRQLEEEVAMRAEEEEEATPPPWIGGDWKPWFSPRARASHQLPCTPSLKSKHSGTHARPSSSCWWI